MSVKRILFSTSNPGKLAENRNIAQEYGIEIVSLADLGIDSVDVVEDGVTFQENAAKKVEAYLKEVKDKDIFVIGDDSGIEIPALDNKPGVFTRRWAGYEMTDEEIIDYCLNQMKHLTGEQRHATFKTILALGGKNQPLQFIDGTLDGVILETEVDTPRLPGLPFNTIFYIPEINKNLIDLHGKSLQERKGFMTHRERALHKIFEYIKSI